MVTLFLSVLVLVIESLSTGVMVTLFLSVLVLVIEGVGLDS